jgi:hypothetical protein
MKSLITLVSLAVLGLSACDVTRPVAVVGPSDTVYRGSATATLLEGGWFQVSNGGNSCQGRYNPASQSGMVTFPVTCTNGLTGVGTATYDNANSGGGEIVMRDGTRWRFIFGRQALAV